MSETTQILEPVIDERSKGESRRLHGLNVAGYPPPPGERLAASEADLRVPCEMLVSGRTPEPAAEIGRYSGPRSAIARVRWHDLEGRGAPVRPPLRLLGSRV